MRLLLQRSDLLWHASMVHACMAGLGGEASLDLASFVVELRARNRYYRLYPRFSARAGEDLLYVDRPVENMRGFAGWLPYVNKRWPIGFGKLAFKDFCRERGLATPRIWRRPGPEVRDFLVKHDQSSAGSGMRGPFAACEPATALALQDGGYYEQFVPGRMVKAWYWEDRLVVFEAFPMPTVVGDGKSTLRALLERAAPLKPASWDKAEDMVRYQGLTLDTVPAPDREVMADFRYASPLVRIAPGGSTLEQQRNSPLLEPLTKLGAVFWQAIPEEMRPATLYTLDAVADADHKLWLLEMNCNPAVHPEAYAPMLERLFGPRVTADAVQPAPAAQLSAAALPNQARTPPMMPGVPLPVGRAPARWIS